MTVTVLPRPVATPTVHRPYLGLAMLQVADVVTTWIILNFWSQRAEGNPVAAAVLGSLGLTYGLIALGAFKLAVVWLFWRCQTGVKIASSLYALVIANNLVFLGIGLWMMVGSKGA